MSSRGSKGHQNGLLNEVHSRVDGFIGSRGQLPMYKDKPYTYAASRRLQPHWRRKRSWLVVAVLVLTGLYFFGAFAGDSDTLSASKWNWAKTQEPTGNKVDWNSRKDRVREAFELSWDAYARYGWGKLSSPDVHQIV